MFLLTEMRDTVRVPPWAFDKPLNEAIMTTINSKMANKVVHNLGLVLTIWDITKLEDSYVFPGDGASHTIVHFRTVIFRPFLDEIITGQIKSCCKEGVYVTLGFFDDILIPSDALQHPSKFDEAEQLWVWQYQTDGDEHELFMDIGEEIRLRVIDETFVDITPSGPEGGSTEKPEGETETKKSPYSLIASISEPGLGLLSWWNG